MISPDVQLGIVEYLRGGTYSSRHIFDQAELNRRLGLPEFLVKASLESEIKSRIEEHCRNKDTYSTKDNGLDIYSTCRGCRSFYDRVAIDVKTAENRVFYRSDVKCYRGGCDKARSELIKNISKMELDGRSWINLLVETAAPDLPINVYNSYSDIVSIATPDDKDRIDIRAELKRPTSLGKSALREPMGKLTKEQQIESDLNLLMKDQIFNYDVEVW